MKITKKLIILTVCIVSLCGCELRTDIVPQYNLATSQAEPEYTEISAESVCEIIQEQISPENSEIYFNMRIDSDTIKNGVVVFKNKNPDFFWLNGYTIVTDNNSTKIKFNILNNYSVDELKIMHDTLKQKTQEISAAAQSFESDYEKILFVHDYIVNNTDYDFAGAESGENGIWGTAYGCLVNGHAICQGYSEAFLEIMNSLGIECGVCAGNSDRGRHAWNYVNLNDIYYWLDVTWDDPESDENEDGKLEHKYFLINDEMLFRTRQLDENQYFIPVCNSLNDNYYVRNNCYMEYYDVDEIGTKMLECSENHEISIMFSSKDVYETAVYSLFEDEGIWTALSYIGDYSEIRYSNDEVMNVVTINF